MIIFTTRQELPAKYPERVSIMAINDVSLTAGMRSNLLSLQNTVNLLARTQSRLSSGKKVNTAIDNPVSFFAAQSLTSRASVIDGLKDAMGQAVQTITAADKGITAITSMIEQGKGIAQSALSADRGEAPAPVTFSTVGAHALVAGTVEIDVSGMTNRIYGEVRIDTTVMTSLVAGTVTIDASAMTSRVGAYVYGNLGTVPSDGTGTLEIGGHVFTRVAVIADPTTEFNNTAQFINLINTQTGGVYAATDFGAGWWDIKKADNSDFTINDIGGSGGYPGVSTLGHINASTVAAVDGTSFVIDGTTYMQGAVGVAGVTGFTDVTELRGILTGAGYDLDGPDSAIVVSKIGETVDTGDISGATVTQQNETAGSTVTIDGTEYMMGRATNGFVLVPELRTFLRDAGYYLSPGAIFLARKAGEDVDLTDISGSTGVTAIAAVAGDTISWGGNDYTAGVDFDYPAELATLLQGHGYANSTVNGNVVTAAITGTTVNTGAFSEVGNLSIAVGIAESVATTFTVGATVYTAGVDFAVGGTDTITATNLAAAISGQAGVETATADGTTVTVTTLASTELTSLQAQYNTLRTQLSELAEDSGYKGKNLLSEDDLTVKFEGATLRVEGFDASTSGLGITAATWATGGDIDADIDLLDASLVTLRQQSSRMSGNLSIISVRQGFSTDIMNTLTEGADKLTLADANEEGGNMLMLQTRQSLSTSALSMSAQAAQSVLRLFQ
jgi:hypothetical protein